MKPFYFGPEDKALFGIYSAPANGPARRGAVLICYPFGPEYLRSHRALRELSQHLGLEGHHTLRFDYFGCGDSAGDAEDSTVEEWMENLGDAIEELQAASGCDRVSLVGIRLGATLAALRAQADARVERVVLWDPIVNGAAYLQELTEQHRAFMVGRPLPRGWAEEEPPAELLGAPLRAPLREGIAGLDLLALQRRPAPSVLVVSTGPPGGAEALCRHLERLGADVLHERISSHPLWLRHERVDRTLVPLDVVQRITSWLGARP